MELVPSLVPFLEPYLPPLEDKKGISLSESSSNDASNSTSAQASSVDASQNQSDELPRDQRPFVTLTWAQSLDGQIAGAKGVQTKISGPETKVMTHYQRSRHDAILVGVRTALVDDPKLNCRYPETGKHMIRPIIIDPKARWNYELSTAREMYKEGVGIAPFILAGTDAEVSDEKMAVLEKDGGMYIFLPFEKDLAKNWTLILRHLRVALGIKSVMIEGGTRVIESVLGSGLADSVVITIGPTFLGTKGMGVCPQSAVKLQDVEWWRGKEDVVMAGHPLKE